MRPRPPLSRRYGLEQAKSLKERIADVTPVKQVLLFGSCAADTTTQDSDIDVAVVCEPFDRSKIQEAVAFFRLARDLDTRMEIIVLHPEDMNNKYSTLVQEVKRHGIEV